MFEALLVVSTLLCGLVTGLLFGFAVVAMPGIGSLADREFIRAFQVMDRVIQSNHPLFLLAWVGSVIGVVFTVVVGFGELDGADLALLVVAGGVYLLGVQVTTLVVNIPLNNRLQTVAVDASAQELASERRAFEDRWNRWNRIRTVLGVVATVLLLTVLARL